MPSAKVVAMKRERAVLAALGVGKQKKKGSASSAGGATTMGDRDRARQHKRQHWRDKVLARRRAEEAEARRNNANRSVQLHSIERVAGHLPAHLAPEARAAQPRMLQLPSCFEATSGGKFSTARPKSDIEWAEKRAREVPPPGDLELPSFTQLVKGGTFNEGVSKSTLDWVVYYAKDLPGPAQYGLPDISIPGGRFNESVPKSELDWIEYRAKDAPGPGQYAASTARTPGGRFNTSNPKSDIDWLVYSKAYLPSPAHYPRPPMGLPRGGKFSTANPKSDIDFILLRAAQTPGPQDYSTVLPLTTKPFSKLARPMTREVNRARQGMGSG